ncbi:MAG: mononuclear molybdenum enzyme YedY, partial [Alphaproteobacteria bacterium]|nr:mononuclear molybdenum enzyme YedY [Alphaproteobacteria bacterium]
MNYHKRPSWQLPDRAVTPDSMYLNRRQIVAAMGLAAGVALTPKMLLAAKYDDVPKSPFSTDEELTDFKAVTSYNNFYEFGTDKGDPARYADALTTDPWSVKVEGACAKPGTYALEDLLKGQQMEERIYRLRCVEAWSMVI